MEDKLEFRRGQLTRTPREGRVTVNCARCSAVLMAGAVLPPGDHNLTCPVCGVTTPVEVSGGTLASLAAAASSAADEMREEGERRRAELAEALRAGRVGGPAAFLIPLILPTLIGTGISLATMFLTRAFTPRQKITTGWLGEGAESSAKPWGER